MVQEGDTLEVNICKAVTGAAQLCKFCLQSKRSFKIPKVSLKNKKLLLNAGEMAWTDKCHPIIPKAGKAQTLQCKLSKNPKPAWRRGHGIGHHPDCHGVALTDEDGDDEDEDEEKPALPHLSWVILPPALPPWDFSWPPLHLSARARPGVEPH